ncbi:MAG: MFS transporter, partial [Gracilibacteraceae bacterium]|nr:MFS transporter [Gracilibacteraceae bacterium]
MILYPKSGEKSNRHYPQTAIIPKQRFAEGMGMFGLSTALATAAAPALGLILMERLGDGAMFTAAAAVVVMALILSIGIRPQKSVAVKRPIDWKNLIDRNALPASSALLLFLMSVGAIEAFIAKFAAATGLPGGGVFFAVMAAVTLLSRLLTGRLADQRGEGIFVYSGNIAMAGALLLLAFLPGPVTYILAAVCSGYGFGGITPA